MVSVGEMKPSEVPPVERQKDPTLLGCMFQHFGIGPTLPAPSNIVHAEHVVTEASKGLNGGQREVFVREEASHRSGCLVLSNLSVDQVLVLSDERPRAGEILRAQIRIGSQEIKVVCPKAPALLEHPNGNARSYDTRSATTYVRCFFNSREVLRKLQQSSQQLRLLRWGQFREESLCFVNA